jgi:hypothetical protein
MTLLSKDEIELTYAKLADGTIVESATFDVGEDLFVVSEDGTKSPAPDGFHDLMLKDTEGNETMLKVKSEAGKIVERENVELADADAEMVEVKGLPNTNIEDKSNEVADVKSPANNSKGLKPASMMAEETEEVGPLPSTGDGMPADLEETPEIEIELKSMVEKLAYRIEEMEKKMEEMGKMKMEEEVVDKDDERGQGPDEAKERDVAELHHEVAELDRHEDLRAGDLLASRGAVGVLGQDVSPALGEQALPTALLVVAGIASALLLSQKGVAGARALAPVQEPRGEVHRQLVENLPDDRNGRQTCRSLVDVELHVSAGEKGH